ncbi:MAG: hypothetical protein IJS95_02090 [Prevotella sp.]|nr:hypothetical protein [Prevotella sp.]
MAKNQVWQDDYWLLLMQIYLRKPTGMKPMYSRVMVDLSIELHIAPQQLYARMSQLANLETPRIERIWQEYSRNPKRLSRAVGLLRSMIGFNSSGGFYDGVEVEETFERDFRPIDADERLTPMMLVMLLDLYFQLTPATMVGETPEVQAMARLMKIPVSLVVDVLEVYQHCDPYLNRRDVTMSPLLAPCHQVWTRYANVSDTRQLSAYANQLKDYFK